MKSYKYAVLSVMLAVFILGSTKAEVPRTLFVYHKGGVEPVMISEIKNIRLTNLDADGIEHDAPIYHEFCTPDTSYRFFIGDIEKVSFESLPTVAVSTAVDLAGEIASYVHSIDYEKNTIQLTQRPPSDIRLEWGTGIYQICPSDKVPYGFVGKVIYVDDNVIYCESCNLNEIFESLNIFDDMEIEIGDRQTMSVAPSDVVPWYAAESHFPDNTVNIMTTELKDIPVGETQPYVNTKVRIQPIISCQRGVYVIPSSNPEQKSRCIQRMRSAVSVKVEASANGRCILGKEETVKMGEGVTLKTKHLGLGKTFSAKFKGTAKGEGSIGVDYGYTASYHASASSAVYEDPADIAVASLSQRCDVVSAPVHVLDASLSGSLSVSGSLTLTITGVTDSIKSLSHVYTFGSKLSGDAFYKTSEIDGARQDYALYGRLTSSGVKASPVESISSAIKYASETLKNSSKVTPTPSTTFYAVPKFGTPVNIDGELSYTLDGSPMKSVQSSLGSAVRSVSGNYKFNATSHMWPGVAIFKTSPAFSVSDGDVVYPTATLQDKVIMCSPSYPGLSAVFTPVVTYVKGPGVKLVSSWPCYATASKGTTVVCGGTPPGWIYTRTE